MQTGDASSQPSSLTQSRRSFDGRRRHKTREWRTHLDDLDTEFELYGVDIEFNVVPEYSRVAAWKYSLLSPATKVRYDAARAAMDQQGGG
jgi:hypothetical protein